MRLTEEQRKIVEQNHNLIYDFLYKKNLNEEEYYGAAAIGLCNAVIYHNHKRGKLSTLAYKCMMSEVIRCIKHENGKTKIPSKNICSYDVLLNEEENESYKDIILTDSFNTYEIAEANINYINFLKKLNDKEKFIVKCFESGLNQTEIAKKIEVKPQAVNYRVKKIKNKWNKFINK